MSLVINVPRGIDRLTAAVRRNVRMAFFGTPSFAVPALRRLAADGWPIAMVVTAPDKPTGRRMQLTPSSVRSVAQELDLPVRTPATLKDEAFAAEFSELRPDLCIVVAYGKLIPKYFLDVPRLGFLNIHPSLLPAYRGPSPIQTAILDGCASTGVSLMLLDEEMDHGPVLATRPWTIPSGFDYPMCEEELARLGADLLAQTLPGYLDGKVAANPQDHSGATVTKKFTREDGRLDWTQPATRVNDRIRALGANPGTWTTWNEAPLNIFHASVTDGPVPPLAPGSVFLYEGQMAVRCSADALILETIQPGGGKRMTARDFANGHPALVSAVLA